MSPPPHRAGPSALGLAQLLLSVAFIELVVYRLAGRALRPAGDTEPEAWHRVLETLGLYSYYFCSALAVGCVCVLARSLWRERRFRRMASAGLITLALACVALAAIAVARAPGQSQSFWLEMIYAGFLIASALSITMHSGDIGIRLGVWFLVLPLLDHAAATLLITVDESVLFDSDLPERLRRLGVWSLIMAGTVAPYLFGARPFIAMASRPLPLVMAIVVGAGGMLIIYQQFEVALDVAAFGLGIDLGPGLPMPEMLLSVLALAGMTWTVVGGLLAPSPARQSVGIAIGLLVLAGYAFHWPLQYLLGVAAVLLLMRASRDVVFEESAPLRHLVTPPVDDEVWMGFASSVARELGGDDGNATVLASGPTDARTTHIATELASVAAKLSVTSVSQSIEHIEINIASPPRDSDGTWMLRGGEALVGDETSARAAEASASLPGTLAVWPGKGLRLTIEPGRGDPVNAPIALTHLATGRPASATPLVRLIENLSELWREISDDAAPHGSEQ